MAQLNNTIINGVLRVIGSSHLGTIKSGVWNGSVLDNDYIPSALTGKTYNGYTLGAACAKAVSTSISSSSADTELATAKAVYTFVTNQVASAVQYLGTVSSASAVTGQTKAGYGDFVRVTTQFTFNSETAHVGDIIFLNSSSSGAYATASNWVIAHTEIDSNTWTANALNVAGFVAAPSSSTANKVWKTDASGNPAWRDDANTWTQNALNVAGYVTAPSSSTANKVWKTDASGNPGWRDDANTTYSNVSTSDAGLCPKGTAVSTQSQTTKFLREDGTWAAPSYTTNTNTWDANALNVAGYVAAPSSSTANKVWKTDASGNPGWRDDANTTYGAGTGLTLSGTTFSVTANTYAAYTHTHDKLHTGSQNVVLTTDANGNYITFQNDSAVKQAGSILGSSITLNSTSTISLTGKVQATQFHGRISSNYRDEFSTSNTYVANSYVWYDGETWKCSKAVSVAGAWTGTANWSKVSLNAVDTIVNNGNYRVSVLDDNVGLMPSANNWNSIGTSGLMWYRSFITNYYGTTSYVTNWTSNNNIGTSNTSSAASTLGSVNFYNTAAANATQTKTTLSANSSANSNITVTLPTVGGLLASTAATNTFVAGQIIDKPTDSAGNEQSSLKIKTSNGGAIILGKEGPNSGTMIRLDQADGTARLRFRASATAGAMVWEQPESGAALYFDFGSNRTTMPTSGGTLAYVSQITKSQVGLGNVENKSSATILNELTSTKIVEKLGYTPYDSTNPDGYITGISSSDVTTALGYTPYNSTNPNGYTSNKGTVTSIATSGTGLSGGTITSSGTITLNSSSAGNADANKVVIRSAAGTIDSVKYNLTNGATAAASISYNSSTGCVEIIC